MVEKRSIFSQSFMKHCFLGSVGTIVAEYSYSNIFYIGSRL